MYLLLSLINRSAGYSSFTLVECANGKESNLYPLCKSSRDFVIDSNRIPLIPVGFQHRNVVLSRYQCGYSRTTAVRVHGQLVVFG